MTDLKYFPANYAESRMRFLRRAKSLQASRPQQEPPIELTSFQVPSTRNDELYVDTLFLPPLERPDVLMVLVSGVHGMEAYVGSAVQEMFFEEALARIPRERVGILVVHSMNPFGFKHHRRVTENNVNLNRNFGVQRDFFSTRNEGYDKLSGFLQPRGLAGSPRGAFLASSAYLISRLLLKQFTIADLIQSIGQGQFQYEQGIEYGGRDFEPQSVFLRERLRELIPAYKDVVLLDLHSGLGDRYQIHLMPGSRKGSVDPSLFAELFDPERDADIYEHTTGDAEGFYYTHGDLNNLLPDLVTPSQRAIALTIEFGTLGNGSYAKLKTINRLINENRGHHHGYKSEGVRAAVEKDFLELFFPTEIQWRTNAIARSRTLFERMIERLKRCPLEARAESAVEDMISPRRVTGPALKA